jgi:hypothetical protein
MYHHHLTMVGVVGTGLTLPWDDRNGEEGIRVIRPAIRRFWTVSLTPAKIRQGVNAVFRLFGKEWDEEFLQSGRELYADLTKTEMERGLEVFKEHFSAWRHKLVNLQERLTGDLVSLSFANR